MSLFLDERSKFGTMALTCFVVALTVISIRYPYWHAKKSKNHLQVTPSASKALGSDHKWCTRAQVPTQNSWEEEGQQPGFPPHQPAKRNSQGVTRQVLAKSHVRSSASNTATCFKVGGSPIALQQAPHVFSSLTGFQECSLKPINK